MNPLSSAAGNVAGAIASLSSVPDLPKMGLAEAAPKISSESLQTSLNLTEVTKPNREAIEVAARQIQHFVSSMERQVNVSKDPLTGYIAVQIVNPATGEVIRTLPSDELMRIARSFEQLGSVMVNQKA
jgi:flagellar protein FlaG